MKIAGITPITNGQYEPAEKINGMILRFEPILDKRTKYKMIGSTKRTPGKTNSITVTYNQWSISVVIVIVKILTAMPPD